MQLVNKLGDVTAGKEKNPNRKFENHLTSKTNSSQNVGFKKSFKTHTPRPQNPQIPPSGQTSGGRPWRLARAFGMWLVSSSHASVRAATRWRRRWVWAHWQSWLGSWLVGRPSGVRRCLMWRVTNNCVEHQN